MMPPDIFCMGCKSVYDGFEEYQGHLEPIQEVVEDDDD